MSSLQLQELLYLWRMCLCMCVYARARVQAHSQVLFKVSKYSYPPSHVPRCSQQLLLFKELSPVKHMPLPQHPVLNYKERWRWACSFHPWMKSKSPKLRADSVDSLARCMFVSQSRIDSSTSKCHTVLHPRHACNCFRGAEYDSVGQWDSSPDLKKKTLERHTFFQLELMRVRLKPAAVGSHSASMR